MAVEDLRVIGDVLYERRPDGKLYPVRRVAPTGLLSAPAEDQGSATGIPELDRMLVGLGNANQMFNPVEGIGQSMAASRRMAAPDTAGWDRVAAFGDMLSGVAGVTAPVAAAGRAGTPAAVALMEGLLGGSPTMTAAKDTARTVARTVAERANQRGPVPVMYSNPVPGLLARTGGERFTIRGSDYFDAANPNAGRAKDPALFSPYSSTKHTTPPNKFVVSGTDLGGLSAPNVVTPSEIQKIYDRIYFATGDRTSAQRAIEEINDLILRNPEITYGGPEYMDLLRSWASEPTAMSAKANAFREVPEGIRSLLAYMPMGERSGDFSKHMSTTYGAATKTQMAGNMAPALREVAKIDALIADKFPNLKDVPSVASEGFQTWLAAQGGGQRAKIIKAFDAANFKALGMPDVSAVRFAITNPDLVTSDALSVGYRMSEPDASGGIIRSTEHPSYGAYLPMAEGTKNMTLGYELPWWIGARNTALPKITPGGPTYALPKDIKSYMGNPRLFQNLDNQWVDESSTYGDLLASKGREAADKYAYGLLSKYWTGK